MKVKDLNYVQPNSVNHLYLIVNKINEYFSKKSMETNVCH